MGLEPPTVQVKKMKTLVTGGLGFIGSNFCRYAIKAHPDIEVTNVDKIGIGANPSNLKELEKEKRYRFVKGDVRDSKLLNRLVKEADAVVNFAAETHVDRSIADPNEFLQNNTVGTVTVLEAIRKHNSQARLVQVSTDEVFGEIPKGSSKEEDPPKPSNPYAASKAAADMFVHAYFKTYRLNASITRCTNNYGPYQLPEKLVPKTIIRALRNLKVPVYGTGMNIRDWIYVQDHCEAIDLILTKGQPGQVYNVSAGNEVPNIAMVRKILKQLGKDEGMMAFVEDRPGHDIRYSLDSSRIRSELGWKPKHSFEKALKETIDWYVRNESWWKPLATGQILSLTPWKRK
jgi:dTDP-glucose 4,6-dehydratase